MFVYVDTGEPVERIGAIRTGEQQDGQSPFRYYIGDREVVDQLPPTAKEGDTYDLSWAGSSGWYQSWYTYHDGAWMEEGTTAPWQLFT